MCSFVCKKYFVVVVFCLSLSILVLLDYRREVLRKWQDKFGLDATYKCLLEILVMSQHIEGAKAVCRVLKRRGEIYVAISE